MSAHVGSASLRRFSALWAVVSGFGTAVFLGLLLVSTLLVVSACTIERIVLYNYENPMAKATPTNRIGPS